MPMDLVSKRLALSGRLKPEARLGLAISEFVQSLDSEHRKEFRSMQNTQDAEISGRDIIKMTEEINREGARRHRSWRPHGTKVGGFLSRIQTFATIGDVLVGGSQNLIATGIWSAVRMSLTIASNYLSYFDKLSTLFMRLGSSWVLHEDFAQLFPASEVLQAFFCEYLVILMKLCNKIVVFCQKNTGAQLLSSLGSSFDSEFGPLQKELDQCGCLIQQQTQLLATKTATNAQNGRFQDLKQKLLRWLSPHQNDFETRWRRQRKKGTCEWIFDTPSFRDWESMWRSATLSVNGKLGSGKTVSMANMVARMSLDQTCAYVFCSSQEPTSLKATNILGSIAFNLIEVLPAEAIAQKRIEQEGRSKALCPESIVELLLSLLPEDRRYIIIADGLENCSDADIDDVLFGFRRLIQNRLVLCCYSSRSDSRFELVAKQNLAPQFSISHDEVNHETELESYIVEEVTRRNATRHLSPDLEELVKKQLIAGAQGMYLWVSLHLDTIFPANSKVVVTDDQILNLITHLPRDLPEAFEQALERISDRQYEGRIMKLVMSAVTPLDLDEIRVALSVVVGEAIWHLEKVAKDGMQLISHCGGNLLDLDEEDGKVRFIHHSVIQHLLSPATSERTTLYHFTVEDAENFIGATCVTYLNLPVLDSRIAGTRKFQSQGMLDSVIGTARNSLPGFTQMVQHMMSRRAKRSRASQVDIGHILSQLQAVRIEVDVDPRCLVPYATGHWLFHTRFFDHELLDCKASWQLWWRLLTGVAAFKPPWPAIKENPFQALLWAVEHAHGSLFRHALTQGDLRRGQIAEIVRVLELRKSIYGQWLGDILSRFVEILDPIDTTSAANRIIFLLEAGAEPGAPHSTLRKSPIEILTHKICVEPWSAEDEQKLIRAFFPHQAVKKSLDDQIVRNAFEKLLESGETAAAAEISACRPDLRFDFHQFQAKRQSDTSAIEKALDDGELEEAMDPDIQGFVNTLTRDGTSRLWNAIETKTDRCVYNLLRLGADPNIGPFKMSQHIESPSFVAICYPLEAALWLRRTAVCLELLRHGADIVRISVSSMQIAEETGNLIMVARLQETPGWSERLEEVCCSRPHGRDGTALVAACKALSHSDSSGIPGFPRPLGISVNDDWTSELEHIMYLLAHVADAEYLNAQDVDGKTALHYLSEAKHAGPLTLNHCVSILLDRRAKPNLLDCHGHTPLLLAIRNSAPIDAVIIPLLEAGAKPDVARLSEGSSVLKEAMIAYQGSKQGAIRLVMLLLKNGADPRDPLRITSPDPFLIASATELGMELLIVAFNKYTGILNGQSIEDRQ